MFALDLPAFFEFQVDSLLHPMKSVDGSPRCSRVIDPAPTIAPRKLER